MFVKGIMSNTTVDTIIFVIVGASGSGKTTLYKALMELKPSFKRCITETTRRPRNSEIPGKDYYFRYPPSFAQRKLGGFYVETAKVHGEGWYGTPKKEFDQLVREGGCIILSVDVVGFISVRDYVSVQFPGVQVAGIFIDVPAPWEQTLRDRMKTRGDMSQSEIDRRIETARFERDHASACNKQIVNDDFTVALEELLRFVDHRTK